MTSFIPLAYVLCTAGYSCKYTELQGQPTPALPPIHCCVHCTTHTLLRELHHPYIAACITLPLTLLHVLHCCPYIAACIILPSIHCHCHPYIAAYMYITLSSIHCCMYWQLIYGTQAITKQLPRVMNMCLLKQKHKTINHVIQHDQCSVQSTCTKTVPNWQSSAQFEQNIIIS